MNKNTYFIALTTVMLACFPAALAFAQQGTSEPDAQTKAVIQQDLQQVKLDKEQLQKDKKANMSDAQLKKDRAQIKADLVKLNKDRKPKK